MKEGKIVMTGGTGFILSHAAERLAETGREIVLFDNNEQHTLPEYIKEFLNKRKNVKYVKGDTRDKAAVDAVINKDTEVVYHFAALMGTSSRFREWQIPTVEVNVIGTINVLEASLNAGVKYFVHPPRPALAVWLTPYIISKTAQTLFTQMYNIVFGLPTIGHNIANCYGPRERAILNPNPLRPHEGRKFMASNIIAALKNEPVIVFGDGEQSSDFVYVDDVVDAILIQKESAIGQVCDIGTGISTPVKKVAEMIIELTKSKSKIEYLPLRTGEVKLHTKADLTNAKKYLGWEPKVSLEEGIRKTIPYYAKLLGIKSPV
ncbi:MAG: GDP-mannose 4,6-dehydratase [Nitrospirota bacterium]